jgi:hypothetical protein
LYVIPGIFARVDKNVVTRQTNASAIGSQVDLIAGVVPSGGLAAANFAGESIIHGLAW